MLKTATEVMTLLQEDQPHLWRSFGQVTQPAKCDYDPTALWINIARQYADILQELESVKPSAVAS